MAVRRIFRHAFGEPKFMTIFHSCCLRRQNRRKSLRTEWNGFVGGAWETEVNVRDFIQKNYHPYDGDESFLAGPTQNTKALWEQVLELGRKEREAGGVLDMDTKVISTITSHAPGYLDKEKETIVGLQTDKPFKRALQPYGGIRMAQKACEELDVHFAVGTIATGDQFICESEVKSRIAKEYAPLCVEMEGAAIAHISMKNDVPFVIIRSMSDDADEGAKEKLVVKKFDITEYCQTASSICEHMIYHL